MNAMRRRKGIIMIQTLKEAMDLLVEICEEESDALENLPWSIRESGRGETMEEHVEIMDDQIAALDEMIEALEGVFDNE